MGGAGGAEGGTLSRADAVQKQLRPILTPIADGSPFNGIAGFVVFLKQKMACHSAEAITKELPALCATVRNASPASPIRPARAVENG